MLPKIEKLENGLSVASDYIGNFETVSVGIFVNVGSVNETKDQSGVSHFVEHMAFKGTNKRSALQISSAIESVGGYMNAYTSKEITAFHVKVLKENIDLAIDVISDIVQNSVFDKSEFEKERGVIIQEIRQLNDAPDDFVFDMFQSKCFDGESLGTQILGSEENINSFEPNDLLGYVKNNYSSDKMILSVSGNIEHEQLLDSAKKYTDKFSSFETRSPDVQCYKGGFVFKKKELEQTHLILGFEGTSHTNPDKFNLFVFSTILGGGMSSRLFQEVREKRGLVYSIFSFNSAYKDTGTFGVYAACEDTKAKEVINLIKCELENATNNITEEEIQKAKMQIKASLLMGLENSSTRMERVANQFLLQKKFFSSQELTEMINNVTIESMARFVQNTVLTRPTLAVIGNGTDIENLYNDFA